MKIRPLYASTIFALAITIVLVASTSTVDAAPQKPSAGKAAGAAQPSTSDTAGSPRPAVPPTGDLPPYWHDFSNDSHEDLVARLSAAGEVRIYVNSGKFDGNDTYTSTASTTALSGATDLNWVSVGQFTSGPYPDIIARKNDGTLVVYPNLENDGNPAQFGQAIEIGEGWNGLDSLNIADVDGDGYSDIVARRGNGDLVVYRHTGDFDSINTLGDPELIGTGWQGMTWIGLGEVTEDGPGHRADIVARRGDGTLVVYPHTPWFDGTNSYYDPVQVGVGWQGVQPVAITDVNGDDFADLLVLRGGQLVTYPNAGGFNGDNTFKDPVGTGLSPSGIDLIA